MISNSKGALQEYCQTHGLPFPVYYGLKRSGVDHSLRFRIRVKVAGQHFISEKNCSTVKKAEKSAARKALEALSPSPSPSPSPTPTSESVNIAEILFKLIQFTSDSKISKLLFEASQGKFRLEIEGNYNSNETPTYRTVKFEPFVDELDDSDESKIETATFPSARMKNKRKTRK